MDGGGMPETFVGTLYLPGTEGIGKVEYVWGGPEEGKLAEGYGLEDE